MISSAQRRTVFAGLLILMFIAALASTVITTGLPAAPALLVATGLWERRAAEPLWPPGMFRSRSFTAQCASALPMGLLMGSTMYASMVFLPRFFQFGRGFTATEAGLLMLPFIAANFAGSTASGGTHNASRTRCATRTRRG